MKYIAVLLACAACGGAATEPFAPPVVHTARFSGADATWTVGCPDGAELVGGECSTDGGDVTGSEARGQEWVCTVRLPPWGAEVTVTLRCVP